MIPAALFQGNREMRKRPGQAHMKKKPLRVDMTPMVDLGFLLISFFVFTAELSRPAATDLYMPKDGSPMPLGNSYALTLLLDKNNEVYWYAGAWQEAYERSAILKTNYSGSHSLREIILIKQNGLDKLSPEKEGSSGLMLLIKASPGASYKNLADVLDEIAINRIRKYAIVSLSSEEKNWLLKQEIKASYFLR